MSKNGGVTPPNPPQESIEYSVTFDRRGKNNLQLGFASVLPENYYLEAGKSYRLELNYPGYVSILTCQIGSFLTGRCQPSNQKDYSYENGIFVSNKSGTHQVSADDKRHGLFNGVPFIGKKIYLFLLDLRLQSIVS